MKETAFRFDLRIDPADAESVLRELKDKLATLSGVLSVKSDVSGYGVTLAVQVCFDDSQHATKLHRKVMNKIIGHEGVTISQVMTKLTDIF